MTHYRNFRIKFIILIVISMTRIKNLNRDIFF